MTRTRRIWTRVAAAVETVYDVTFVVAVDLAVAVALIAPFAAVGYIVALMCD